MASTRALQDDARWWLRADAASERTGWSASRDRKPFNALVVFTIILLLAPQNWVPATEHLRIALLSGVYAVACTLWECWSQHESPNLSREILVCFALPAWAFLTMPLSYWPGGSLNTLTTLYIKAVIVFWLLASIVTTKRRLEVLTTVLILCTVPLAFTAIKHYVTGTYMGGTIVSRILGYDSGLTGNPNDLALMLNLLLPIALALLLNAKKTSHRVLYLVIIAMDAVAVILTFSRAGFLGLCALGLIYFTKLIRRSKRERFWAFALLLLAFCALPFLPRNYSSRIATVTDIDADSTGSSQERWAATVAAAQFIAAHPIVGAGIGMDVLALNEVRGPSWRQVHNIYFELAVDLGFPGLILFLLLFFGVFKAVWSSQKRLSDQPDLKDLFHLVEALKVSLIVFFVSGFFYPIAYHFYFYYMAGLTLATRSVTADALAEQIGDLRAGGLQKSQHTTPGLRTPLYG
jgi:probable O-glycosylation ligase (exosortase A-associated)